MGGKPPSADIGLGRQFVMITNMPVEKQHSAATFKTGNALGGNGILQRDGRSKRLGGRRSLSERRQLGTNLLHEARQLGERNVIVANIGLNYSCSKPRIIVVRSCCSHLFPPLASCPSLAKFRSRRFQVQAKSVYWGSKPRTQLMRHRLSSCRYRASQ